MIKKMNIDLKTTLIQWTLTIVCKTIIFRSKWTILKSVMLKPFPRLKPGSKSKKIISQRPFNLEKYELTMRSIKKIDVN